MKVEIYSMDKCKFCTMAKGLLAERDVEFTEKNTTGNVGNQQELIYRSKHQIKTLPQIFVDDVQIGGYQELLALVNAGKIGKVAD